MHFESWSPVENIVSAHISSRPIEPNKIVCPNLFVYTTKCSLHKFINKKKRVTLSYHTGQATIANALVKTCFWSATTTFLIFKRWYSADRKNCILLSKTFVFGCRIAFLRFLRIWNHGRRAYPLSLYEPSQSVHWLEHRLVFWIYNAHWFFFLSIFDYLLIGIILRISWDKTLYLSTLTNYSQLIQFSFLHRRIRRACAHAVSKEPSTTIDIK